jgi:transposase InsO family protein
MKRRNNLFGNIVDYTNIRMAFLKAIRGKRAAGEALLFCRNIDAHLNEIRTRLLSEHIRWGAYHHFTITDPKKRIISAAPFEDRIIHHAVMNVLEPLFERQMVYHNYACRRDKGMHSAVRYAFSKCKGTAWFLKLDIRKYFDSINHEVLKDCLRRKGNCWDNACAESFFKTLKRELETLDGNYSAGEVRQSVFMYLEAYYNRIRLHSALDYVAPNVFDSGKVA